MAVASKNKKRKAAAPANRSQDVAIENIVGQFIGCRVAFTWFGAKRNVSDEQRDMAASPFGAEGEFLGVRKKILDTKSEEYGAVTAVRGRINKYWKAITIPYIEPGWRLIKLEHVASFRETMAVLQEELREAVAALDATYERLREEARAKLGTLYDDSDYPGSLREQFDVGYDFPAIHPPECLKFLDDSAFNEEVEKFRDKLDRTVKLTEAAFVEEFTKMISHLRETLSGVNEDGKPRHFKDSTVDNLKTFFDRFEALNLGSNPKFSEVVAMAKRVVGDNTADDLREVADLRSSIASEFAGIEAELKEMTVVKPKRRILRPKDLAGAAAPGGSARDDEEA